MQFAISLHQNRKCPLKKETKKGQLLDNLYFFCQKLKLKEYFYGDDTTNNKLQKQEICDANTKLPYHYFSPNHESPLNLQGYIYIYQYYCITSIKRRPG